MENNRQSGDVGLHVGQLVLRPELESNPEPSLHNAMLTTDRHCFISFDMQMDILYHKNTECVNKRQRPLESLTSSYGSFPLMSERPSVSFHCFQLDFRLQKPKLKIVPITSDHNCYSVQK